MKPATNWADAFKPLIEKYKHEPPSLYYGGNIFRLLVMVLLAAKNSDDNINKIAPAFFKEIPDMESLSKASTEKLTALLSGVRFHRGKIEWLQDISSKLKEDKNIPRTMKELVDLKGIGRKSANVIMAAAKQKVEGIIVDLHVLRVVDRLGISHAKIGDKMEKDLMAILPQGIWAEVGSAISSLGRDTCRPTNPIHAECVMSKVCEYCLARKNKN